MSRLIGILGYCLIGVSALVLAVRSRMAPDKIATFGRLLDQVMTSRTTRMTLLLFWWWLGWHFFVVAPGPD